MGEARRREALSRIEIPVPRGSVALSDCANRVLMTFAEAFDAVLFIKEREDDLLDTWPAGLIIGSRAAGVPRRLAACHPRRASRRQRLV